MSKKKEENKKEEQKEQKDFKRDNTSRNYPPTPPHPPPPFGFPPHPFIPPPPPFGSYSPSEPLLPFDRESFKDIRQLILLTFISDNPEGITGYQLQETYQFPRGTLLRDLEEFEDMDYVKVNEDTIKGRAQKFYTITEDGKNYIEKLKVKWASRLAMMSEMAPPEIYGLPIFKEQIKAHFLEMLENLDSKEDALDFFKGVRFWLKTYLARIIRRQTIFEKLKSRIADLILKIEKMEDFNRNEIKEEIKKIHESFANTQNDIDFL
ncbi:MAG: hypothetical protein GF353_23520 [Candidatus Lokiarchaeota archaeon]|nr:hypothetical protein [Candidatus Lokiarchaeota archaeon]